MPLVRYINPNNKKECVIPPDNFFHETKPRIEQCEHDLLCSIGFCTIVSLPHILIVETKSRFVQKYGESIKPKLERIVYVAYDLATRVVSLFPVQQPRNNIAAALIYLCGPFAHPIDGTDWWKEIYNADMTEIELIQLSELICDAWTTTKDYYTQIHCRKPTDQKRQQTAPHQNAQQSQIPGHPGHHSSTSTSNQNPNPNGTRHFSGHQTGQINQQYQTNLKSSSHHSQVQNQNINNSANGGIRNSQTTTNSQTSYSSLNSSSYNTGQSQSQSQPREDSSQNRRFSSQPNPHSNSNSHIVGHPPSDKQYAIRVEKAVKCRNCEIFRDIQMGKF